MNDNANNTTPAYRCEPKGQTDCPAYGRYTIAQVPPAREDNRLASLIDWKWVRRCIRDGFAVAVCVGPGDEGLLIDAVQQYVGCELLIRIDEPGAIWFYRRTALEAPQEKESTK